MQNAKARQMDDILHDYLKGLRECLAEIEQQDIAGVGETIYQAYKRGKKIFILGNGGSAATASHMVCDLVRGASVPGKPRLKVQNLTDNTTLITAISNDVQYEDIFYEQLLHEVNEGDVVIGIGCSGNSPNLIKG